jgi:hypothetical protein
MNEQEWLDCTDPMPMLEFLQDKVSDRKLRLFAVACCRSVWHLLNKRGRRAVAMAESFADGMITASALEKARERLRQNANDLLILRKWSNASHQAARRAIQGVLNAAANNVNANICWRKILEARLTEDEEQDPLTVQIEIVRLVRDVFGNPFWLLPFSPTLQTPTTTALAQFIYDFQDFTALQVLVDALEEAGCNNLELLAHLRGPGPHVLGCWALDLVLNKK